MVLRLGLYWLPLPTVGFGLMSKGCVDIMMEGRSWHRIARDDFGAKLRPDMQRGKAYLYQIFTTCFVEFDTVKAAQDFRDYADDTLEYWDFDPVTLIDTNIEEQCQRWAEHMEDYIQMTDIVPPFPPPAEPMSIPDDALFYISGVGTCRFIQDGETIWEVTM